MWSGLVEVVKQFVTVQKPYDTQLVDTFGTATFEELNYENEAQNQLKFKRAFADSPSVYVPDVRESTHTTALSTTTRACVDIAFALRGIHTAVSLTAAWALTLAAQASSMHH